MLVLIVAGLHEPVMALIERFGSDGAAEFRQIGPIWLKLGIVEDGVTTMAKLTVVAHCPAVGVNV